MDVDCGSRLLYVVRGIMWLVVGVGWWSVSVVVANDLWCVVWWWLAVVMNNKNWLYVIGGE